MDPHFHAGLDDEEARRQAHEIREFPSDVSAMTCLFDTLANMTTTLMSDPTRGDDYLPAMLKASRALGHLYATVCRARVRPPLTIEQVGGWIASTSMSQSEINDLIAALYEKVPL